MRRFTKKRVVAALSLIAVLAVAGGAYAYFTSGGTGTGSATVGKSSSFTVATSTATGGALLPATLGDSNAVVDTIPYTVTNNDEGDDYLSQVVVSVTPGFSVTDGAGDPACTASDFSINGAMPGSSVTLNPDANLKPNSDGPINDVYSSSVTLQLVENNANQDSCQNVTVPLTFTAS